MASGGDQEKREKAAHADGGGAAAHGERRPELPERRIAEWRAEFRALTGIDPRDAEKVKAWQAAHGVPPTGLVRQLTIAAARKEAHAGGEQADVAGDDHAAPHAEDAAPVDVFQYGIAWNAEGAPEGTPSVNAHECRKAPAGAAEIEKKSDVATSSELNSSHGGAGKWFRATGKGYRNVYPVEVTAGGEKRTIQVLTFLPDGGVKCPSVDVFLFLHGIYAEYGRDNDWWESKPTKDDPNHAVKHENPAQHAQMAESVTRSGRNVIALLPQWDAGAAWNLDPGGFSTIVSTVLARVSQDLSTQKEPVTLAPGAISVAAHSGGARGVGGAADDFGDLLTDITIQDGGYGYKGYGPSFEKARDWLVHGKDPKRPRTVRLITRNPPADDADPKQQAAQRENADSSRYATYHALAEKSFRDAIAAINPELSLRVTPFQKDPTERDEKLALTEELKFELTGKGGLVGTMVVFRTGIKDHWKVRDETMPVAIASPNAGDDFGKKKK